ncbi:endonuclease domain-containing protein [Xanthobacteraceae bacterium A53D]
MADESDRRHWRVGGSQRKRARGLRTRMTEAEQKLWLELRGHRLCGLSFRRQHPIAAYVVDFGCLPASLVVELDGGQHFEAPGRAHDARRDAVLVKSGFRVLRFSNLDVLQNMAGVLEAIVATAGKGLAVPPPQPSPASGRGSTGAPGASVILNSGADLDASSDTNAPGARPGAKR